MERGRGNAPSFESTLMKNLNSFRLNSFQTGAVCLLFASLTSLASAGQIFQDTQNDLFDNGLGNLDITNVWVENTATDITFSVTTREFQSWTKYMIFLETTIGGGTGTNAWSRPIDLSGAQIDYFVNCILNKKQPQYNSFEQAMYTDYVIEMIVKDAKNN